MLERNLDPPHWQPARADQGSRPYFFIAASMRSTGMANTRRSFGAVIVSAASSALVIAASVACAVAWNSGVIRSLGSIFTSRTGTSSCQARGLAVENAMKMSPELLPPKPPCRPMPSETRVAIRFS